jgi:hypothetical protein
MGESNINAFKSQKPRDRIFVDTARYAIKEELKLLWRDGHRAIFLYARLSGDGLTEVSQFAERCGDSLFGMKLFCFNCAEAPKAVLHLRHGGPL